MNVKGIVIVIAFVLALPVNTTYFYEKAKENNFEEIINNGRTLYVGGNGPGNYSRIQDAINDAMDGDTIIVYSGIYEENIVVDKSLKIIGINYPLIDACRKYGLKILANNCSIKGFRIYHGEPAIEIRSDNNIIEENIIKENGKGILINDACYNLIKNNTILRNEYGIVLSNSSFNIFIKNNISYHIYWYGMKMHDSNHNQIIENTFSKNFLSLELQNSDYNIMRNNKFLLKRIGWGGKVAICSNGNFNELCNNTFVECVANFDFSSYNKLIGNYGNVRIYLWCTKNFIIQNNFVEDISIEGYKMEHFIHEFKNNRKMDGKIIFYLRDAENYIIPYNVSKIILLNCSKIRIENYSFCNNVEGIEVLFSRDIEIKNNLFKGNTECGIYIIHSKNVSIYENEIIDNDAGILAGYSSTLRIVNNNIFYNECGLKFWSNYISIIKNNNFKKNDCGLCFWGNNLFSIIINNNFIGHEFDTDFINSFFNLWLRNYWDRWCLPLPKPIMTRIIIQKLFLIVPSIPWLNFDLMPRLMPYERK